MEVTKEPDVMYSTHVGNEGAAEMKVPPIKTTKAFSKMGLARTADESITALASGCPSASARSMKSISKIEFLTMMPARAIMPIMEVAVNWAPQMAWPGMTPITVSGMGTMIMSGAR